MMTSLAEAIAADPTPQNLAAVAASESRF